MAVRVVKAARIATGKEQKALARKIAHRTKAWAKRTVKGGIF